MRNFRLVILDYPKLQIDNPTTKTILSDILVKKQKNFERSDEFYIPNDKHDLIGTHFLIYDTTNPFQQKLVFGIRLTYEDRARLHKINLPILDLLSYFDKKVLEQFNQYRLTHPLLVDCNALFVDQEYTHKKSGLRLIDIGYVMIYFHLMRSGHNHFVGGSNEKYKSSRWVENIGNFRKDLLFIHPMVPDPHMLVLIDSFNVGFAKSIYMEYRYLFDNIAEFFPANSHVKLLSGNYQNVLAGLNLNKAG